MANTPTAEILERGRRVLIGNYPRQPLVMDRGERAYVWDTDGRRYLDLFAGFGGAVLGHCHPALVKAATEQAGRLWHVGNTFYTTPQIELAERLNRFAFEGRAFFFVTRASRPCRRFQHGRDARVTSSSSPTRHK